MKINLILIAFVFIFLSTEYTGNFSIISVANAQEQQSRKTKRVGSMSEKVAKKLGEA